MCAGVAVPALHTGGGGTSDAPQTACEGLPALPQRGCVPGNSDPAEGGRGRGRLVSGCGPGCGWQRCQHREWLHLPLCLSPGWSPETSPGWGPLYPEPASPPHPGPCRACLFLPSPQLHLTAAQGHGVLGRKMPDPPVLLRRGQARPFLAPCSPGGMAAGQGRGRLGREPPSLCITLKPSCRGKARSNGDVTSVAVSWGKNSPPQLVTWARPVKDAPTRQGHP